MNPEQRGPGPEQKEKGLNRFDPEEIEGTMERFRRGSYLSNGGVLGGLEVPVADQILADMDEYPKGMQKFAEWVNGNEWKRAQELLLSSVGINVSEELEQKLISIGVDNFESFEDLKTALSPEEFEETLYALRTYSRAGARRFVKSRYESGVNSLDREKPEEAYVAKRLEDYSWVGMRSPELAKHFANIDFGLDGIRAGIGFQKIVFQVTDRKRDGLDEHMGYMPDFSKSTGCRDYADPEIRKRAEERRSIVGYVVFFDDGVDRKIYVEPVDESKDLSEVQEAVSAFVEEYGDEYQKHEYGMVATMEDLPKKAE